MNILQTEEIKLSDRELEIDSKAIPIIIDQPDWPIIDINDGY